MNEFEQERNRLEQEAKQHEADLSQYSISTDLASQVDRLHDALQGLRVRYLALDQSYEQHLQDLDNA